MKLFNRIPYNYQVDRFHLSVAHHPYSWHHHYQHDRHLLICHYGDLAQRFQVELVQFHCLLHCPHCYLFVQPATCPNTGALGQVEPIKRPKQLSPQPLQQLIELDSST